MKRTAVAVIFLLAAGSCPAWLCAAPAAQKNTDARIADLEKRMAELEALLSQLAAAGASPDVAELQRRLDLLSAELEKARLGEAAAPKELTSFSGLGPAASKVYGRERGVSIGGYGEAIVQDYAATADDGTRTGKERVADLLRAVLYFGYKFNDTIVLNTEIEFEHGTTGEGSEEKGEVSVEFATLDFLLHKSFNARAGLMLMPVGIINEMHEPPTFLGVRRPDVETRVLPSTWREVGVGVFGDLGPVSYRAYVVNGFDAEGFSGDEGLREGRQGGSEATARDLGFVARADYHGFEGLVAGASFYTGHSGQGAEDGRGRRIDGGITMYDVHAEYAFRGLQIRALWASIRVDDADRISRDILMLDPSDPNNPSMAEESVGSRIEGWYGQAGYDVLTPFSADTVQSLIPFVRYERYDTQDRVPSGFVTTGANDVKVLTYGAVYKPIPHLAIKLDFQDVDRGDDSGTDQVNAGISYLF